VIVKRSKVAVVFGAEEPMGWLPAGAVRPRPTPAVRVLLNVVIDGDEETGYNLVWNGPTQEYSGDRWYARLADAEAEAAEFFNVSASDWEAVD
jgi:hypothetical protein